jgi:hypothetical protein
VSNGESRVTSPDVRTSWYIEQCTLEADLHVEIGAFTGKVPDDDVTSDRNIRHETRGLFFFLQFFLSLSVFFLRSFSNAFL